MADTGYRQLRTSRANDVLGTIKRTFSYINIHYKWRFALAIFFILLSSLAGVISSYLFTPIINDYIVPYIGKDNPDLNGFIGMLVVMATVYIIGVNKYELITPASEDKRMKNIAKANLHL